MGNLFHVSKATLFSRDAKEPVCPDVFREDSLGVGLTGCGEKRSGGKSAVPPELPALAGQMREIDL